MINQFARASLTATIIVLVLAEAAKGQSALSPVGVWRGTSLCLVKPSPCHDEVVVYRITPMKTPDSVSFDAFKIVNGQEEDMGTLSCRVRSGGAQLTCAIPRGTWRFNIRGDSLTGDLVRADGSKFRDVRTARSK